MPLMTSPVPDINCTKSTKSILIGSKDTTVPIAKKVRCARRLKSVAFQRLLGHKIFSGTLASSQHHAGPQPAALYPDQICRLFSRRAHTLLK